MFLNVYQGQQYSYSLEVETGHFLLFKNDYKLHSYLQGDDARLFDEEIDRINNLPPPQCNDGRLIENLINNYL